MKWVEEGSKKNVGGNKASGSRQGKGKETVNNKIPDKNISKPVETSQDHSLKIRFHYKGYFIADPVIAYEKGEFFEFGGSWDIDEINLIDLDKLVKELGVKGDYKLWYVCPGAKLKDGLRLLKTDRDVIRFINEFKNEEAVEFYVETNLVQAVTTITNGDSAPQ